MSYIPFEALLTEMPETDEIDYRNLSYLIKQNPISYEYSANLLYNNYFKHTDSGKNLLALAPSYNNIGKNTANEENKRFLRAYNGQLTEIAGAKEEAKNISKLFGGDVFINSDATESAFKKTANNYNILHLAMHTIINDDDPMYSKLVFTQTGDTAEDGFLNTYELYNMQLHSQLVVLSACSTGAGNFSSGEGVMSLARGFRYAGVQSVVMTLWPVEDNSSSELMTLFYFYLAKKIPKDEALRSAKLDFLKKADPLKAHPYFWAGYVDIGNTSPVSKETNHNFVFYTLAFVLSGLFSAVFIRRVLKRKANSRTEK